MPKVSHTSIRIDGQVKRFDIYYGKEKAFTVKDFPEDVVQLSGLKDSVDLTADTEAGLIKKLNLHVDAYHKSIEKSEKVIICKVAATTDIMMNYDGNGSYSGNKNWVPKNMTDLRVNGWGFTVDYEVSLKVNRNGEKFFKVNDKGKPGYEISVDRDECLIIEWTQEREEAFKSICNQMEELIKKVSQIMLNEKKALQLLDSQTKLLA